MIRDPAKIRVVISFSLWGVGICTVFGIVHGRGIIRNSKSKDQRVDEDKKTADDRDLSDGCSGQDPLVFLFFDNDLPVLFSDSHSVIAAVLHHDSLEDCLAADPAVALFPCLFFTQIFPPCDCILPKHTVYVCKSKNKAEYTPPCLS